MTTYIIGKCVEIQCHQSRSFETENKNVKNICFKIQKYSSAITTSFMNQFTLAKTPAGLAQFYLVMFIGTTFSGTTFLYIYIVEIWFHILTKFNRRLKVMVFWQIGATFSLVNLSQCIPIMRSLDCSIFVWYVTTMS